MRIRLGSVLAVIVAMSGSARAADFTVTTIADAGAGSLRDAITQASAGGGADTITITATGTIQLASELPHVVGGLELTGPGAAMLTIRGTATFGVLTIDSGDVRITGVTITNGRGSAVAGAGGITLVAGSLQLIDSVVTANQGAVSSGVEANGPLIVTRCTLSANTGGGPVVVVTDDSVIADSTIAGNTGRAVHFAPRLAGRALTIDRSTISGNNGGSSIGGLQLQTGITLVTNSTFSGNTGTAGGDFWISSDGTNLQLDNVTSTSAGPALQFDHLGTVTMRNTIFAGTGPRCSIDQTITSGGHNLTTDSTCGLTGPGDQEGVADARLGPLADNGGPTRTHTPLTGSPALGNGDGASPTATDQRGLPRLAFGAHDVGAVEVAPPTVTDPTPASVEIMNAESFTLAVTATNPNSAAPLTFRWRRDGVDVAGATAATLTVSPAHLPDAGMYDVVVTNEGGSVTSGTALVIVHPVDLVGDAGTGADAGADPGGSDSGCCSTSSGAPPAGSVLLGLLVLLRAAGRRARRSARRRPRG